MIGIGFWDSDGRVTDPNDALLEMIGYTREDFASGKVRYSDFTAPEYREADEQILDQTKATGSCDAYEKEYIHKSGERVPVLIGGGCFEGCTDQGPFFALDISAVRQTEQALDANRLRLRAVFDTSLDSILLADDHGRYIDANPAACKLLDYHRDELLSLSVFDVIPITDIQAGKAMWAAFIEKGEQTGELTITRKDGEKVFVEYRAVANIQPGVHLSVLRDVTERHRTEILLRESEVLLRRILDSNAIGLILADFQGNVVKANDAFLDIIGYERSDLDTGRLNFRELTPTEYHALDDNAMAEMSRVGRHTPFEKEFIRKDGSRAPVLVGTAYLGDGDGDHRGIGFIVDLSRQKEAQAALRESEQRLRTLSNNLPYGAIYQVVADAHGGRRFLYISAGVERMLGITSAEAEADATSLYRLIHEEDRPLVAAREEVALRDMSPFDCEFRCWTRDGDLRWFHCRSAPRRLPTGDMAWEGIIMDVTARKSAEKSLGESEARFRAIFDQTVAGVAETDLMGRFVLVNQRYCEIVGRSAEELYELRMQDITHPDDLSQNAELFKKMIAAGRPFVIEKRYVLPDGSPVWVHNSVSLVRDEYNQPKYTVAVVLDVTERRQAENDLKMQARVLDNMTEGVSVANEQGIILFTNPAEDRMFGYAPGELAGKHVTVLNAYPSEENQRIVGEVIRQLQSKGIWVGEWNNRKKDGTPFTTFSRITALEMAGAKYWVCVQEDVTDRKHVEAKLRASAERLDLVVNSVDVGLWYCDLPFNRLIWNTKVKEHFGLPADYEVTIDTFFERLHPDDRDRIRQAIERSIQEHSRYDIEYRTVGLDGRERWIRAIGQTFYDAAGKPLRFDGITVDNTEQKRSEHAAQRRSEQVRRLAEVATRISLVKDEASLMEVITEEARSLIGAHQAVGSTTVDQNWGQAINAVSMSEKYERWRHYDTPPDGTGIYAWVLRTNLPLRLTQSELEAHPAWKGFGKEAANHPPMRGWMAVPLVGRDGRRLGLIQLSDRFEGDFTEEDDAILVQLARMASVAIENVRLLESLREADRRKDEFLATLAHELRNPLAPLRNGLQLLRLSGDNRAMTEQAQSMMDRQLQQMVHLIDDLLDVSRITRGKLQLRLERVELASVIQSAIEDSRPVIESFSHQFTVQLPFKPIHLNADPTRLAQVLGNLLTNAAKYTDRGGRIHLSAGRQGNAVIVSVKDTGIGISAEHLPRLFEMFSQVSPALERTQGGLGIGLSLVKGLVEMHGGTVEARSEGLGKGSEFIVRLPVIEETRTPPDAAGNGGKLAAVEPKRHRRILVADDNRDGADSLAMMLRFGGHQVHTARDGQEAFDAAGWFRPDVAILDIGMPKLTGYECCRQIRQQPWGRDMIVIALTGWGYEEDKRRAMEAGFNHHLTKPVAPAELEQLLASLTART